MERKAACWCPVGREQKWMEIAPRRRWLRFDCRCSGRWNGELLHVKSRKPQLPALGCLWHPADCKAGPCVSFNCGPAARRNRNQAMGQGAWCSRHSRWGTFIPENCRVFTSGVVASNDAAACRGARFPPQHCEREKTAARPPATLSRISGPSASRPKIPASICSVFATHTLSVSHTMDRRTYESPMDWEYHSQPPMDESSPFAKFSQKQPASKFFARPLSDLRRGPLPRKDNSFSPRTH
jgi:hypothetical protein